MGRLASILSYRGKVLKNSLHFVLYAKMREVFMSQVLPQGDRWAMAGLVLGCVLFGLGSLIIVFVPLGSFAMSGI